MSISKVYGYEKFHSSDIYMRITHVLNVIGGYNFHLLICQNIRVDILIKEVCKYK